MKSVTVVLIIAIIVGMMTRPIFAQSHEPTVAIYVISSPGLYEGETQNSLAGYFTKLMATTNADTNVVIVSRSADCWTRLMPNSSVGRWRLARDAAQVVHQTSHFPTFQDPSGVVAAVERHFMASYAGEVSFLVWTASDGGGGFKSFEVHPVMGNGNTETRVEPEKARADNYYFPFASESHVFSTFLLIVLAVGISVAFVLGVRHRRNAADKRLQKYLDDKNEMIREKRRATHVFMNTFVALMFLPLLAGIAWSQQQIDFVDFSGSFVKYRPLIVREIAASLRNGPVVLFSIGDSTVLVDTLRNESDLQQILTYPIQAHTRLAESFITMQRVAERVQHSGKHPIISFFTDGLPDDAGNQELDLLASADTANPSRQSTGSTSIEGSSGLTLESWLFVGTILCFVLAIFLFVRHRRSKKHPSSPHGLANARVRLVTKSKSPMNFDIDDLLAHKLSIGPSPSSDVRLFNVGSYELVAERNQSHGINIVFDSLDAKDGFKLVVENVADHK